MKRDDESVGDGGSSDVEGEGGFKMTLLEDAAQDTVIEHRDNDNVNIKQNVHHSEFNITKTLPQRDRMYTENFKLLKEHLNSWNPSLSKGKCQMCGKITYA